MAHTATVERTVETEAVSELVVSAVAELTDTDPISLEPLYEAVDPDALDALFEGGPRVPNPAPRRVSFTYSGCDVVVTGSGSVRVSEAE